MKLKQAFLCVECEEVFEIARFGDQAQCPICLSSTVMSVKRYMDREKTAYEKHQESEGAAAVRRQLQKMA